MPATFTHQETRKAAKDHKCDRCLGTIHKGTKHLVITGRFDLLGLTRIRRHLTDCSPTYTDRTRPPRRDETMTLLHVKDRERLARAVKDGPGSYRLAATAAGMSHAFVAHLCVGRRDAIALPMALRLATAVDVPPADLYEVADVPLLREHGLLP